MEKEPIEIPIEDTIDLHTFQPQEIKGVVEEYLFQAARKRFFQVRIIHGRGIGVQREIVHRILSRHTDVLSFSDAPDRGATIVHLRLSPPQKLDKSGRICNFDS
jgi:dsDNA-specific endonuclease/ATPase MutS2